MGKDAAAAKNAGPLALKTKDVSPNTKGNDAKRTRSPRPKVKKHASQSKVMTMTQPEIQIQHALTPAEAYANAHSQRERGPKDKENTGAPNVGPGGNNAKKPIFEWITRKLGSRRVEGGQGGSPNPQHGQASASPSTYPSPNPPNTGAMPSSANPSTPRGRLVSLPVTDSDHVKRTHQPTQTSPKRTSPSVANSILTRDDSGRIRRSESHSLRLYSHSLADSERARIREMNNPYPSLPVSMPHRDSTLDSTSMSFLTRSRTSSIRSDMSIRPRISLGDDASLRWSVAGTNIGADEDASIRPFPPSHPASPTPSASIISRSASGSLLSPINAQSLPLTRDSTFRPPPPSPQFHRPDTMYSGSSSANSSDGNGRQSRQDSTSTKPTTVFSIESGPHPAHIAQDLQSSPTMAQSGGSSPRRASDSMQRTSMDASVDDPSGTSTMTPTSPLSPSPSSLLSPSLSYVQAPKHSQPHPRDNPNPQSPPDANASTLTLASSNFAIHGNASAHSHANPARPASIRLREISTTSVPLQSSSASTGHALGTPMYGKANLSTSPSVTFAAETMGDRPPSMIDSGPPSTHALSLYGGPAPSVKSLSVRTGGWQGGRGGVADRDASVRALRRNGSRDSIESKWSWRGGRIQSQGPLPPGVVLDGNVPPWAVREQEQGLEYPVEDDDEQCRRNSVDEDAVEAGDTTLTPQATNQVLAASDDESPMDDTIHTAFATAPTSATDSLGTKDSFLTARSGETTETEAITAH